MPLHLHSEAADSTKQLFIQKFNTTTLHLSMDCTTGNVHPLSYANFTPIFQVLHKQCWFILYAPHCSPCCLDNWNQYKYWLVTWCRFVNTYFTVQRARSMTITPSNSVHSTLHSQQKWVSVACIGLAAIWSMTSHTVTQSDRMVAFVVGFRFMDTRKARESAMVARTATCKFEHNRTSREDDDEWRKSGGGSLKV